MGVEWPGMEGVAAAAASMVAVVGVPIVAAGIMLYNSQSAENARAIFDHAMSQGSPVVYQNCQGQFQARYWEMPGQTAGVTTGFYAIKLESGRKYLIATQRGGNAVSRDFIDGGFFGTIMYPDGGLDDLVEQTGNVQKCPNAADTTITPKNNTAYRRILSSGAEMSRRVQALKHNRHSYQKRIPKTK